VLPASSRLRTAADFRQAVRRGRRAAGALVVVHLVSTNVDKATSRSDDPEGGRVGFVVSGAVGRAVTRNRVRRRLRHLMRERLDLLPASSLLVVRAQPAAADAGYRDLAEDLDRCLQRVVGS
jgi:ribonuclease P protein component